MRKFVYERISSEDRSMTGCYVDAAVDDLSVEGINS